MTDAYQILVDCPNCLVEGAVAELLDPQIAGRVAVESLCRLCGRECALGELVFSGRRFESRMDARRALAEWATREGEASVDAFCAANFGGMDADEAALALIEGRPIASNFDVFTHLFSNHVQATQTRSRTNVQRRATLADLPAGQDLVHAPADGSMRETAIETPRDGFGPIPAKRLVACALSAVLVADGRIRRNQLRFLASTLSDLELPPLSDVDVRPWRPGDLPEPHDPIGLIRLMAELAAVDVHQGGTEWRVIREFGRYWGVPQETLDGVRVECQGLGTSQLAVLWRGLKSLLMVEV